MHLSHIRTLLLSTVGLVFVSPLAAQDSFDLQDSAPVITSAELPMEFPEGPFQSVGAQPAAPLPAEAPSAEFRRTIQDLKQQKHQYVHCKLKTGRVLTGKIKDAGFEAFSIKTEAVGGVHYVRYDDLAEAPRPVPAVGTRIKQGVQWTGIGALIAVAIPVLILFSPFLYLSGWDC